MLRTYTHLQQLDLSNNRVRDCSEVAQLPYLQTLNASGNQIASVEFFEELSHTLQYLKVTCNC